MIQPGAGQWDLAHLPGSGFPALQEPRAVVRTSGVCGRQMVTGARLT